MRRFAFLVGAALLGCGAATPAEKPSAWIEPSHGQKNVASGSTVERLFPLVDGKLYQYRGGDDEGHDVLRVARVVRTDARHGELRYPDGARRFEYDADGVKEAGTEGYLLKAPLELGAQWRGPHGGSTHIQSVDAVADVPAGKFVGCLQTVEERLGDRPVKYLTTFCPDVGVVSLEASSGNDGARVELSSYGDPVKVGPDGLTRVQ